jgi:hypothetical protein
MIQDSEFAYIQARIQARHGARPSDATWRRLEAIADLTGFLYGLRETSLAPWVKPLTASADSHAIEQLIRDRWAAYTELIASRAPLAWKPAIAWCAFLPALPAAHYLRRNMDVPVWVGEDPYLKSLDRSDIEELRSLDAWVEKWQGLWPRTSTRLAATMTSLQDRIIGHLQMMRDGAGNGDDLRADLDTAFTRYFRRFAQSPIAVFCHLGLTALDVERMRGGLMVRRLFPLGPETPS